MKAVVGSSNIDEDRRPLIFFWSTIEWKLREELNSQIKVSTEPSPSRLQLWSQLFVPLNRKVEEVGEQLSDAYKTIQSYSAD